MTADQEELSFVFLKKNNVGLNLFWWFRLSFNGNSSKKPTASIFMTLCLLWESKCVNLWVSQAIYSELKSPATEFSPLCDNSFHKTWYDDLFWTVEIFQKFTCSHINVWTLRASLTRFQIETGPTTSANIRDKTCTSVQSANMFNVKMYIEQDIWDLCSSIPPFDHESKPILLVLRFVI